MITRRHFIKSGALIAAGTPLLNLSFNNYVMAKELSGRPELSKRKFVSDAIEAKIKELKESLADKELARLFENCFPNTLDTTVNFRYIDGKPDTFVITGDIEAMWLRDSSAQVYPYIPFAKEDKKLKELIAGVINKQTKCILIDPYANAFNDGPTGGFWQSDKTKMKLELHERKYEIDSLCYPIRLAHAYWKATGDTSCFTDDWKKAIALTVQTFREQQRKDNLGPYTFQRVTDTQTDTAAMYGYGNPIKPVGLIVSVFRPSDDSTIFSFLIPANFFAVTSLRHAAEILTTVSHDAELASKCTALADEVESALKQYAVINAQDGSKIYAYEADGYGNTLFMDDANVPSLLALPYLGCCAADDPMYVNTRKHVLSDSNPYFYKGSAAEGVGSPHTPIDSIWPIAITMRALTSTDDNEIKTCLEQLKKTPAGTYFMHESFNKNNPEKFSRSWFAWANTLFGELVLKVYNERPHLVRK
ncbi:MAG TPA: glycoside hydrolase family 125 protein [Ignavibacteriales bacterium]|nr:glycoside hydrolase family 125 protein [Ignavibacteriales bacterium]